MERPLRTTAGQNPLPAPGSLTPWFLRWRSVQALTWAAQSAARRHRRVAAVEPKVLVVSRLLRPPLSRSHWRDVKCQKLANYSGDNLRNCGCPFGCPQPLRPDVGIVRDGDQSAGMSKRRPKGAIRRLAIRAVVACLCFSDWSCRVVLRGRQATSTRGERCRYWRARSTHSMRPSPRSSATPRALESAIRIVFSGSRSHC